MVVILIAEKLTEKQEKFAQAIMQGKTQRQAYYEAYPNSKEWKPEVVDSKASTTANNGKVLERLEYLRQEAAIENKVTRKDLIEQLKTMGFADIDIESIRPSDKIKALEVIAKILGYDKPDTEINITINPESCLSTEELKALAKNNPL